MHYRGAVSCSPNTPGLGGVKLGSGTTGKLSHPLVVHGVVHGSVRGLVHGSVPWIVEVGLWGWELSGW